MSIEPVAARVAYWLANLAIAREMWLEIQPGNVNLNTWRQSPDKEPDCNTIACFGGWCALRPEFQALGVGTDAEILHGAPTMVDSTGERVRGVWVALELFGETELFEARGGSPSDYPLRGPNPDDDEDPDERLAPDWDLVLNRIDCQIAKLKGTQA